MEAASAGEMNVTYAEIRQWAVWLQVFTASDIADAMGVPVFMGERAVRALLWQGICEDTGDLIDGPSGPESIISYIPLPPGPTHHPHETPVEIVVAREMGGDPLGVIRGYPVARAWDVERRSSQVGTRRPGRRGRRPTKMRE